MKQKERDEATQVFASAQQPADATAQDKATTFEPDEELAQAEAAAAAAQQQVGSYLEQPIIYYLTAICHALYPSAVSSMGSCECTLCQPSISKQTT